MENRDVQVGRKYSHGQPHSSVTEASARICDMQFLTLIFISTSLFASLFAALLASLFASLLAFYSNQNDQLVFG
jgi:hypothetical protein